MRESEKADAGHLGATDRRHAMSDWKQQRQEGLARRTVAARGLVGKTIADAEVRPHDDDCDSENLLVLTMTDGTVWRVLGSYGGYTGHSCDEYPEMVSVSGPNPESESA